MQTSSGTRALHRVVALPDVVGLGGAVAGFLAGIVMIGISPLLSLMTGIGIFEPPKLIAATVYGPAAMDPPGFVLMPVLVGTLLHLITSTVLGFIFGVVFHRLFHLPTAFGTAVLIGLCYGILIFLGAYFLVLPIANPTLHDSYMAPFVAQNMIFGICLGIFYTWLRPQPYEETRGMRSN